MKINLEDELVTYCDKFEIILKMNEVQFEMGCTSFCYCKNDE